jgi:5,10-methylenetetrahydromethanopterin reductase
VFEAGARRVDFGSPHGIDERTGVDLLAREVAPRLRS